MKASALLREPARPAAVARHPQAHWLAVATVCVGAFMGQLDASIVTVAFPTMQRAFHATVGAVEWVALSYLLVLVGTVTAVGRVSDMVGRKLLYVYGFVVFTAASVLCALAPNLLALDAFRVLQALGAAMLQANSVALITHAMPPGQLGRGIGVQGAAQATGLALGPTVGGFLIGLGGWQLIFYVNVPAGVLGAVLGWFLLPRSHNLQPRAPFDWTGLGLFLPATGTLLLALSLGREHGMASAFTLALFAASAVTLVLFVLRERTVQHPMLDLGLFRRLPFTAGISSGFLSYLVLFGVLFVVPFYLERAQNLSPADSGVRLTALPVALGLVAPFAGFVADRVGARLLTAGGMVVTAGSLLLLATVPGRTWVLVVALAAAGVGLGAFTPSNNAAIMGSAPRAQSGVAAGVLNMTRGIGTAMGVAVTALVFATVAGHSTRTAAGDVSAGFRASLVVLAGLALVAAALAALRGAQPIDRTTPVVVE